MSEQSFKISDLFSIEGKVALVTGGSRGIGLMIAQAYVTNGVKVYISSRKAEVCENVATELSKEGICIPIPVSLDPEVLANASLKLLQRLCFVGNGIGGIEDHGREPGLLRGMRQAVDAGNLIRIGELSPQSSKEELTRPYTWRFTTTGRRAAMNQPEQRYPFGELWESDDPLEQTPVDERHKVLQESTQRRWERLKKEEIKEDFTARDIKKAKEELDILNLPEQERIAYDHYQEDLHFQASMVESSYGLGKKEGMKEGEKQKAVEIAQQLIDVLDTKTIAEKTGLSIVSTLNILPNVWV